jgi:hypothetical protein
MGRASLWAGLPAIPTTAFLALAALWGQSIANRSKLSSPPCMISKRGEDLERSRDRPSPLSGSDSCDKR